jgi:hypothetical protein
VTPDERTLPPLAFQGRWRRYQELALEAFERDRGAGRRSTHVLAPPGSGKTVLGMEIVRRLGARALVLCPNSAVQAQWLRTAELFGAGDGVAAADADAPIACLTYQSLCQVQDPEVALGNAAERRWTADRARALGVPYAEVEREAASWRGAAARRRSREVARIRAAIKREIARGGRGDRPTACGVACRGRQRRTGPAAGRDPSVAATPLGAAGHPYLHRRGDIGAGRHAGTAW